MEAIFYLVHILHSFSLHPSSLYHVTPWLIVIFISTQLPETIAGLYINKSKCIHCT
jgi:hypothetical protein